MPPHKYLKKIIGAFCIGPPQKLFKNNASEEKKALGKAP